MPGSSCCCEESLLPPLLLLLLLRSPALELELELLFESESDGAAACTLGTGFGRAARSNRAHAERAVRDEANATPQTRFKFAGKRTDLRIVVRGRGAS